MTIVIFHDFLGLENSFLKFHNFPGCVGMTHQPAYPLPHGLLQLSQFYIISILYIMPSQLYNARNDN